MIKIDYPAYAHQIRETEGKEWIFDPIRKKWARLTPEEWVRQNFIQYLLQVLAYPSSLIAVEKEIRLGELQKRFDLLVYQHSKPWMIIECKEMNVPLTDAVLRQVLNYHTTLQANYLIITNGTETHAFSMEQGRIEELSALPEWNLKTGGKI